MKTIFLSLGSNLGDRVANLQNARGKLADAGVRITQTSSLYETEPQGLADQPWFLNQVLEAKTELFPRQLLTRLKKIERELGRKPTVRNGPRVIDLDILFYGSSIVHAEGLEIPHPRLSERRFVLEPLAEIAPDLRHPATGQTAKEMLAKVSAQKIRKYLTATE